MPQPDENGFVKRGFMLLGGMTLLVAVVLSIIFHKPEQVLPSEMKDLPANASEPGWKIRYNATNTLLRRGSKDVRWDVVREMLDEKQQLKNCEDKRADGRMIPDENLARSFVKSTLEAVAEWRRKSEDDFPNDIRTQVDKLAQSPIPELKIQAEKTRLTRGKEPK